MAASLTAVTALFSFANLILLTSILAIYEIGWIVYARYFHPLSRIPGPWLASVSRVWYMVQIARGDMERTQRRLHAQYGPLIRIAHNEVACAAPDAIRNIYRHQGALDKTDFYPVWNGQNFSKHPDMFTGTSDKIHGERRRIFNHVYTLSNVLKSEEYIDKCSKLFLDKMGECAEAGKPVDLGKWFQMYAFDVVGELYFGRWFGFMERSHDHGTWIHSLELLMPFLCMTAVAPTYIRPLILASALVVPGSLKALKAVENIGTAARDCVAQRFAEVSQAEKGPSRENDMLGQLYAIHKEKGEQVDFQLGDIEQESYVALFAGSDTTAIAFRSIFYHLMKSPDVYDTLMQEIDRAAARHELSSPVKYSEAIKLPFLSACIKEGLRMHPSVQLSMARLVPAEGLELCGNYIPAGYRVGMNPAVVHFDRTVFGDDADQYRPGRWLADNATEMDKYMLHFGAGTRTCIGKNISLAEIHKLTPYLLRKYTFHLVEDHKTWSTNNLWFCTQQGIVVRATARPEAE